jgi:hypothetical protein
VVLAEDAQPHPVENFLLALPGLTSDASAFVARPGSHPTIPILLWAGVSGEEYQRLECHAQAAASVSYFGQDAGR